MSPMTDGIAITMETKTDTDCKAGQLTAISDSPETSFGDKVMCLTKTDAVHLKYAWTCIKDFFLVII